jgi:hypothetical protein
MQSRREFLSVLPAGVLGAGCVTAALLEELAGVEDTGAGFRSARISPRWLAAGTKEAEVTVRYPA